MTANMTLSTADSRHDRFVCKRSEGLFSVIERCLDNGTGICFIVGDDQTLLGRITLDDIRRALHEGMPAEDAFLGRLLDDPGNPARRRNADQAALNEVPGIEVARPLVDRDGRLVDILIDRSKQHVQVARPELSRGEFRAVLDAFLSTWISSKGANIPRFEREFSSFVGARFGVAVSNGTAALHLALTAHGIGPADEVIVPDLTFAATINAVLHCGAKPLIVDIDPQRWSMSVEDIERVLTRRTKAIVPVHLYGRPADMGGLGMLAREYGLYVVEDCAEAHGARYAGRRVGQFGDVGCFSFFANKIITTGEGGICLTDLELLASRILELRDHGMAPDRPYWHHRVGYNYRMTNLQAAIGVVQLARVDERLERNRRLERLYREYLSDIPGVGFPESMPQDSEPVVWLVTALVPAGRRAALIETARAAEIEIRPFFNPLSAMPVYRSYARHCPNSVKLSRKGVALPTSDAVDVHVVRKIAKIFRETLA